MQTVLATVEKFQRYAPYWTGPATADTAVQSVLSVIDRASVRTGDSGSFVSQYGNKQWL